MEAAGAARCRIVYRLGGRLASIPLPICDSFIADVLNQFEISTSAGRSRSRPPGNLALGTEVSEILRAKAHRQVVAVGCSKGATSYTPRRKSSLTLEQRRAKGPQMMHLSASRSLRLILLAAAVLSYFPLSGVEAANAWILPSAGKALANLNSPQSPQVSHTRSKDAVVARRTVSATRRSPVAPHRY